MAHMTPAEITALGDADLAVELARSKVATAEIAAKLQQWELHAEPDPNWRRRALAALKWNELATERLKFETTKRLVAARAGAKSGGRHADAP